MTLNPLSETPHIPAPAAPERRRTTSTPTRILAQHAVDALLDKRGLEIRVMDLRGVSGVADTFVLATGESELQVRAMVDAVRYGIADAVGEKPWHVEGNDHMQWVVLDYVDLVVHVFMPEKRAFYALERLWGDAPAETVPDTASGADVRLLQEEAAPEARSEASPDAAA